MKYKIKDFALTNTIIENYNLPYFCAKVLASYDKDTIKDVLTYQSKEIIFDNVEQAISLINEHILSNNKIVIMGDYDCDGILATSIMVKGFAKLGYEVGYYIPNRIEDGYGINVDLVDKFIAKGYRLIITVDNGINAKEAIEYAKKHGVDVIITDHHTPDKLMECDAIYIHPKYSNLDYEVSGGYVAYMFISKLIGYEDDYLHALAAITLISDVMPLVKGNRVFIRQALKNIQDKQYLQIISLASGFVDSSMIGTIIAPKINSLGRLPDIYNPNTLVQYFCSNKRIAIINYAKEIEECNNIRKQMTSDYFQSFNDKELFNNFLMIEDDDIHEGLLGLIASRFTNQYHCVSMIATSNNLEYKASIRSISEVNIYDIVSKRPELFIKYGGHSQAMGISYQKENSREINEFLSNELSNIKIADKEYEVILLDESDLTLDNIVSLRYLEPFGNGFEQPLFLIKDAIVANIKALKGNIHYRLNILYQTKCFEIMIFNNPNLDISVNDKVDLIVKLGINNFNGKTKLNIIVEDYVIK
ncbi:single-stranded-DNA-specific exonuclease [Bacilli bacterium PM5-3]|nr:single-stranded-DNA-specific exonuclease [Bacilli bacterium PM5-3]